MIKDIAKMLPLVKDIMVKYPSTKDNDELLLIKVWEYQNPGVFRKNFSYFALEFVSGLYAKVESVTRARRKLQELDPSLRGKAYNQRHKAETETRVGINNIN